MKPYMVILGSRDGMRMEARYYTTVGRAYSAVGYWLAPCTPEVNTEPQFWTARVYKWDEDTQRHSRLLRRWERTGPDTYTTTHAE